MNLPRPSAKTATTPAELASWLSAAYDVLLPLSADAISPERMPALLAITMPTLDELRATRGDPNGLSGPRACVLVGKLQPLDGSEGVFVWDATSTLTDDDAVTTVESPAAGVPDGAPGRWRRLGAASVDVQEFSADGLWTKPLFPTPTWVRVEMVPWGASGQGGANGGGGGASGVGAYEGPASLFGATEAVTLGAQPIGGAGGLSGAAGSAGTDAPDATFGAWLRVQGGKKGAAGVGGAGGYGNLGTGGAGGNNGGVGSPGTGRAGGGGAGSNAGPGGSGGPDRATTLTGGAIGAPGGAGAAGSDGAVGETGGGGGGGGGGNTGGGTAGGAGGNGGRYGAGGAAGGSSSFGFTGGKGGDGAPCYCRVTTWF